MDIENMKAFVAAAELQSISAAAAKLNHLQSNMTAKIKKMEAHYEQELFIRSSKGVQLTKEGKVLYDQFKKMLLIWEETENKMKKYDEKLRIGAMMSVGGAQLAGSLSRLYQMYPDLSVTLKTGSTEYIEEQLLLGHIDLAFTIGSLDNKNIHYEKSGIEEMVIIGGGIEENTGLEAYLEGKNLLMLSDKCLYLSILQDLFAEKKINQGEIIEVGDMQTLVQLASIGMGISLVSKRIAKRFNINQFLEVPPSYRYVNMYMITRVHHQLTPIEKQFAELSHTLMDH
ncbi:LysR family transcriptional regulator [Bacillus swezeyi]|uniref:LysR family transcriptional regulator n=1 Tax=Bacillus swezeyi TaxID=1925020 RepID=UPI0027DDF77A|nr:LysR family transcriptional regulator [Bacillus swezeyi]